MKTTDFTDNIAAAADCIKSGGIVAVPTETVYGLAANGLDAEAVERIFTVKGRPENKPISLMVQGVKAFDELCAEVPRAAYFLAEAFWPGPLTLVLKAKAEIPEIVRAGGNTVGLRCPKHEKTQELMAALNVPLAVPSANPSGAPSARSFNAVLEYFDGKIEGVIDGGDCEIGRESTVLDLSKTPYATLRAGAVSDGEIDMALVSSLTIIGITGGTGCGKTTALDTLRGMGGLVLDSDEIYHELLANSAQLRREIDERFPGALPAGSIDTKDLGKIVFSDPEALSLLGAITHKFVGAEIMGRLSAQARNGGELAAIDAIALIENGIAGFCKATVGITAPTEKRIERLMRRESISREYAELRINAQKPNDYFESVCDHTISNDSTMECFAEKCKQVFNNIITK
jgi:L-threonylcarbamoyladenylate synthase